MKKIKFIAVLLTFTILFTSEAFIVNAAEQPKDNSITNINQTLERELSSYVDTPYIESITRDCITFSYIDDDCTVYVKINEKIYTSTKKDNQVVVLYPLQDAGTEVTIWSQNDDGSKSSTVTKVLNNCDIYTGNLVLYPYPKEFTIIDEYISSDVEYAIISIGDMTYRETFKNNRIKISYPLQKIDTKISFTLYDKHNCPSEQLETKVENSNLTSIYIYDLDITNISATYYLNTNERLCVQIGSNIYYSKYATTYSEMSATFPSQKNGTKLVAWIEAMNGSCSAKSNATVDYSEFIDYDSIEILAKSQKITTTSISGIVIPKDYYEDMEEDWDDYDNAELYPQIKLKSIKAVIGSKTYTGKITGNKFVINYPLQKPGTIVKIIAVDTYDFTRTKQFTIKNKAIKLSVYYSNTEVWGQTEANAKITAKIGKKTYKSTANSKGAFTIKAPIKIGTSINLTATNKNNYYNSAKFKTKDYPTSLSLKKAIFVSTTSVSVTIKNPDKNNTLKITIGSKVYTKKIKSYSKKATYKIKIKKPAVGQKIKIVLYNQYKQKRKQLTSKVYLSDTIRKGMTMTEVLQTTWGAPTRRNSYSNGIIQWVYEFNGSTTYVYFQNGKIISLNRYNY